MATACACALLALGASRPAAARADTMTVTILDAEGAIDPVAGVTRFVHVDGASGEAGRLWIKYRPADGTPCASTPMTDPGTTVSQWYGISLNGPAPVTGTDWNDLITFAVPGPYLFCTWYTPGTGSRETDTATPIAQTIVFRPLQATASVTVAPASPAPGSATVVTLAGSSDVGVSLRASYRPADGTPCPAGSGADTGTRFLDVLTGGGDPPQPYVFTATIPFTAGSWQLCTWIETSSPLPAPFEPVQTTLLTIAGAPAPASPSAPAPVATASASRLVATRIRTTLPARAHRLRLAVAIVVTAAPTAQGTCTLQVLRGTTWHTLAGHGRAGAGGRCAFTARLIAGSRRYRVAFRPASGFAASFGPARTVRVTRT